MKPDLSSAAAHDRPSLCDRMLSNSWFVMVWLALDYFVLYLHRSVLNFVLPPLQAELQITEAQIGNMQMAFLLPYCFSQLFVGYLGDRFHRRTVLLVSLIGSIVCLVGKGMVVSFSQLILLQIALGALQSASVPAIAGMMADCFTPRWRSTAVAIYLISQNVAIVTAGWLGGTIAGVSTWTLPGQFFGGEPIEVAGWRMAMFIFSGFGIAVAAGMLLFLREPSRTEREENRGLGVEGGSFRRTVFDVLRMPSYLLITLAYVLTCVIINPRSIFLAKYFHDDLGMSLERAGFFSTFFIQIFTVVGLFVGGIWADQWAKRMKAGRLWVQVIGVLLIAPALVVLGTTASTPLLIVAMSLFGLGLGIYTTNLWTTTFDVVDPAARSTATAFLNVASLLAASASPIIGHWVDQGWMSYGQSFAALSIVAVLTAAALALCALFSVPRDYRGPLE